MLPALNREQAEYELRRAEHNYRVAEVVLEEAKDRLSTALFVLSCFTDESPSQEQRQWSA